jgi:dihydroflavonol-4-reductase
MERRRILRHYTSPPSLGYRAPVQHDQLVPIPPNTLVTGATGFVGSAVARALLARGHALRLLVRPSSDHTNISDLPAELVEGDLREPAGFAEAVEGCTYVVHVAADYRIWVPDPAPMMRANVDGTSALLRAARDAGVKRIVYCSSVAALGLVGDGTPGTEDTPVHEAAVVGVYKRSKYLAEQEVRRLVREEGVPAVIVNPSAPIGPRDIKPTPTGKMVLDAAAGRMPAFVDTGLNVVHVDDVGLGHVLALERGEVGEAYILGGTDLRLEAILAMVDDIMGRGLKRRARLPHAALWPMALGMETAARTFRFEPLVTREMLRMAKKQMFFSWAKAGEKLGYVPRPPRQALADAIAWFQANGRLRA